MAHRAGKKLPDVPWVRLFWSEGPGAGAGGARGARGARSAGSAAGAARAAPGNHVDVTARWLQQRRCHIDVGKCGGRPGADGTGAAGAPDEVPAAGACDAVSPAARPLPPKSRTHVTLRRSQAVPGGTASHRAGPPRPAGRGACQPPGPSLHKSHTHVTSMSLPKAR